MGEKIFSRTSRSISIKLDTKHLWVKGILNSSNKGSGLFERGDNHKNTKMGWDIKKSPSPEPLPARIGHIYINAF
jgi:hypothetical protein